MFKIIYAVALSLAALILLPKLVARKGFAALRDRYGRNNLSLRSESPVRIWVHAVSLGETKAVIPLMKRLKARFPDAFIIFSTTTETGQKEALQFFPEADRHLYLPYDLWSRSYVKEARPTLVILSETDFWYNFLDEAKKQGARLLVVNGKLSLNSLRLYRWVKGLFSKIDLFLVQSDLYKQRFLQLAIPEEKIEVTGNLKLDVQEDSAPSFKKNSSPILVIGSTHDPEEKLFLNALKTVWSRFPDLKVYLVPRHPERFDKVARLIEAEGLPYSRFSESQEAALVLVDAMGKLKTLFREADLCVVAGSWTPKVGGHNILEPCHYGKPTLFGPYMFSQPDFLEQVLAAGAGLQIPEDQIASTLVSLLENRQVAEEMGARGRELIEKNRGSLEKTFEKALHLIQPK